MSTDLMYVHGTARISSSAYTENAGDKGVPQVPYRGSRGSASKDLASQRRLTSVYVRCLRPGLCLLSNASFKVLDDRESVLDICPDRMQIESICEAKDLCVCGVYYELSRKGSKLLHSYYACLRVRMNV